MRMVRERRERERVKSVIRIKIVYEESQVKIITPPILIKWGKRREKRRGEEGEEMGQRRESGPARDEKTLVQPLCHPDGSPRAV